MANLDESVILHTRQNPAIKLPEATKIHISSQDLVWVIVLLCFFGIEMILLRTTATREVTWAYPAIWDQTFYLYRSYLLHHKLLTDGFSSFMTEALQPTPQGFLMPVQAAIFF